MPSRRDIGELDVKINLVLSESEVSAKLFYNYRVNQKKSVISGILADFGNFFFQPVMATNIIENFTIFEIF